MSDAHSEVRQLVAVLALKVQQCRKDLKAQEIGNALYGLQRMSDSNAEVRQLVAALAPKVQKCRNIDAQAVGNALYGLQRMSDSHEVQLLTKELALKMQQCSEDTLLEEVKRCKKALRTLPRFRLPLHLELSFVVEAFRSLKHPTLKDLARNIDIEFEKSGLIRDTENASEISTHYSPVTSFLHDIPDTSSEASSAD